MPLLNPFRTLTDEEKKAKADSKKLYLRHENEAIKAAKLCANSPLFRHFVKRWEVADKELDDALLSLPFEDATSFAFKAWDILSRRRNLRALKSDVEKDAERKILDESEETKT